MTIEPELQERLAVELLSMAGGERPTGRHDIDDAAMKPRVLEQLRQEQ